MIKYYTQLSVILTLGYLKARPSVISKITVGLTSPPPPHF